MRIILLCIICEIHTTPARSRDTCNASENLFSCHEQNVNSAVGKYKYNVYVTAVMRMKFSHSSTPVQHFSNQSFQSGLQRLDSGDDDTRLIKGRDPRQDTRISQQGLSPVSLQHKNGCILKHGYQLTMRWSMWPIMWIKDIRGLNNTFKLPEWADVVQTTLVSLIRLH